MRHAARLFQKSGDSGDEVELEVARLATHLASICENQGWQCALADGPQVWKDAIVAAGGWLNPGFDPEKSDVDERNASSVVITDAAGEIVACNALRIFVTESFRRIMRRGDLFYGPRTTRLLNGMPLCLEDDYEDFGGTIGYSGGTFVARKYRGLRLGLLTTRFVRLIAEGQFQVDHHAGLIFQNRPLDPRPKAPYHYARCRLAMPFMRLPDRHQDEPLLLVDIRREEFLSQVQRNVRDLVREGNETLDDLALLVP